MRDAGTGRTLPGFLSPRGETVRPGEAHLRVRRLVSPVEAAAYLGLGSRFAIYRLVSSGRLPAVRLANKIRLDLQDLDVVIQEEKSAAARHEIPQPGRAIRPPAMPRQLAPRRRRRKAVTGPVTGAPASG